MILAACDRGSKGTPHRQGLVSREIAVVPGGRVRHGQLQLVLGWCREAGLEVAHPDVIESGISVRASRPRSLTARQPRDRRPAQPAHAAASRCSITCHCSGVTIS
jgi:hypothetical protein